VFYQLNVNPPYKLNFKASSAIREVSIGIRAEDIHIEGEKKPNIIASPSIPVTVSLIEYLIDKESKQDVVLLLGNKTHSDIIFKDRLDSLPDNFRVVYHPGRRISGDPDGRSF